MASSRSASGRMSRRLLWLTVALVVLTLLYTGGWFYAANRLAEATRAALGDLSQGGNRAVCESATVRGFPFRIGVYCDATYVERGALGAAVSTGPLRSAAQVFSPKLVVAEADSPARLSLPGLVPLDVEWQGLHASARLARPLPERVSIEADGVKAVADMPNVDGPTAFSARRLEFHLRPSGPDLDIATRFDALQPGALLIKNAEMPPISGLLDLTVKQGIERLRTRKGELRGTDVAVHQLEIRSPDGAAVTATGTISIGEDGLIDAELTLGASEPAALAQTLSQAFPAQADRITSVFAGLAALGENPSLPVTVNDGQAYLGFVRIGQIPPL